MHNPAPPTEQLIRNERRGIWLALLVVATLAATLVLGSDTRRALLLALAVAIVFAVAWLSLKRTRGAAGATRTAVLHDELRQAAMAVAYQWAFVIVLAALAAFCLLSTVVTIDVSGQRLAACVIALAASAFLAIFLIRDRG